MFNFPQFSIFLLVCVSVQGRNFECDKVEHYDNCWNLKGRSFDRSCWKCEIIKQNITDNKILNIMANDSHIQVDSVRFSDCFISQMPTMLQKEKTETIVEVELDGTKTAALNAKFFANTDKNLKVFKSILNKGLTLEGSAFRNWTSLEILHLSKSNLSSMPFGVFFGLNQLVGLNLEGNKLKALSPGIFQGIDSLECLNMSLNNLLEIPNEAFKNLTKLRRLDLQGNKIKTIEKKTFQHNNQLEMINLKSNRIEKIQNGTFSHLDKLTQLNFIENKCDSIYCENKTSAEITEVLSKCHPIPCEIPEIKNGSFFNTDNNSPQSPGDSYENFHPLEAVCNSPYVLYEIDRVEDENFCILKDISKDKSPFCYSKFFRSNLRNCY